MTRPLPIPTKLMPSRIYNATTCNALRGFFMPSNQPAKWAALAVDQDGQEWSIPGTWLRYDKAQAFLQAYCKQHNEFQEAIHTRVNIHV